MTCGRCDGEGQILICVDDLCRGTGECIHGDGYAACPICEGSGEVEDPDEDTCECGETRPHNCESRGEREDMRDFVNGE